MPKVAGRWKIALWRKQDDIGRKMRQNAGGIILWGALLLALIVRVVFDG